MSRRCPAEVGRRRPAVTPRAGRDAAALDLEAAIGVEGDGFGEGLALGLEDAGGEGLGRVVVEHRHGLLEDDRAGVVGGVGEVDGAAADLHARSITA